MNSETGHLVSDILKVPESQRAGYEPLPPELHEAARRKLRHDTEAYVSQSSGGKLSRHAARRRRQMQRQSRSGNRGR